MAHLFTGHKAATDASPFLHFPGPGVFNETLCRVDDVYNRRWPDSLDILDQLSSVPSVSIWRINLFCFLFACLYTFCCEVVQLLVIGVHYNFLLVTVLEWLRPWHVALHSCYNIDALGESNGVSTSFGILARRVLQEIHKDGLSHVVSIVACQYFIGFHLLCSPARLTTGQTHLSRACLRNTPQYVQLLFNPICFTTSSIVQSYRSL